MIEENISYMAGILDGEGCFAIHEKKTPAGTKFYRPRLTVTNTDPRLIKWCLDNFGGSFSVHKPKDKKIEYIWTPGGIQSQIDFLGLVLPYLYIKRDQADVLGDYLVERDQLPTQQQKCIAEYLQELKDRECVTTNTPDIWKKESIRNSYLAGLLDAEGSISGYLSKESGAAKRQLNIANNVRTVLDYVKGEYCGFIQTFKHKKKEHATSYRVWVMQRFFQEKLLNDVLPYIKLKKQQAILMLDWLAMKGQNKQARVDILTKIHSLNQMKIESDLPSDRQSGPVVILEAKQIREISKQLAEASLKPDLDGYYDLRALLR